ncbi:MAG: hypothetical protein KA508_06355 [Gammaproteobacteria bacterium]|nr:hypothetical protein [Gammaproteobacteria bacterium]
MSKLSIDNSLNILGIPVMPAHPQALDAAYEAALRAYQSAHGPASEPVLQLLKAAQLSLQNAGETAKKACASDPGYAARFDEALSWITTTPLSFEILGAWLWVSASQGRSALFESELRARGFEWASKKACWFLKPKATTTHSNPKPEPWDLERIRSAYAYRPA